MRLAGVGRLVVVTDPKNSGVSLDAWMNVRWVRTSRALSRELEELYLSAMPSAQRAGSRNSAVLILGEELADAMSDAPDDNDALRTIAAVHGFELRKILRCPERHTGSVLNSLRQNPPGLLVVAAPPGRGLDAAIEAYRAAASLTRVSRLGRSRPGDLLDDFREAIAAAAGINPALFPASDLVELEAPEETKLVVPDVWPVAHQGQRKIHPSFGFFVENLQDGCWYTRDRAQHAGCVVKRYQPVDRQLIHDADIDAQGKIMAKHKGDASAALSLDDMRGV
jgi:hypothetical protein